MSWTYRWAYSSRVYFYRNPRQFCNVVALHRTPAVICDPHEIANVLGLRGIDYFLQSSIGLPVKVYVMMPSCLLLLVWKHLVQ